MPRDVITACRIATASTYVTPLVQYDVIVHVWKSVYHLAAQQRVDMSHYVTH
jgi:hypothetical protein